MTNFGRHGEDKRLENIKLVVSEILNDTNAYNQMQRFIKDEYDVDIHHDSMTWHEIETAIAERFEEAIETVLEIRRYADS